MAEFGDAELREKNRKAVKVSMGDRRRRNPPTIIHSFDVALLIDVCKAIVAAEAAGSLYGRGAEIAKQAHIILGASAKAGTKGLVYALAGYNPASE